MVFGDAVMEGLSDVKRKDPSGADYSTFGDFRHKICDIFYAQPVSLAAGFNDSVERVRQGCNRPAYRAVVGRRRVELGRQHLELE
jgi:hypothetical protein